MERFNNFFYNSGKNEITRTKADHATIKLYFNFYRKTTQSGRFRGDKAFIVFNGFSQSPSTFECLRYLSYDSLRRFH